MKFVNPDPTRYAMGLNGWVLRPKQCPICFLPFMPFTTMQVNCFNCVVPEKLPEQHFIPFNNIEVLGVKTMLKKLRVYRCNANKKGDVKEVERLDKEIIAIKQKDVDYRLRENRK